MLLRKANAIRFSKFPLIVAVAGLLIGVSGAIACVTDLYDRDLELQAIRKGLSEVHLSSKERSDVEGFLRIASVDPRTLSLRGFFLQAKARGDALQKLGADRIPAKPQREFDAIRLKLASTPNAEGEEGLRNAETLWGEHKYDSARNVLRGVMQQLRVEVIYHRC